jgi:hypothetical protein
MLCTVELDRDLQFAIPHIQAGERIVDAVHDTDLRFGFGQTRAHQQESRPGFLRGLGAPVHEPENLAQLHQAADSEVALRKQFHVGWLHVGSVGQRVDTNQR